MPKKKKDYAKRDAGYALRNCDRIMVRLLTLSEMFKNHPSGMDVQLEQIAQGQLFVQNSIRQFCIKAWGKVPNDLSQWTGSGRDYVDHKRIREAREAMDEHDNDDLLSEVQTKLAVQPGKTAKSDYPTGSKSSLPPLREGGGDVRDMG